MKPQSNEVHYFSSFALAENRGSPSIQIDEKRNIFQKSVQLLLLFFCTIHDTFKKLENINIFLILYGRHLYFCKYEPKKDQAKNK